MAANPPLNDESERKLVLERAILEHLDSNQEIQDSGDFSSSAGFEHKELVNVIKSLNGFSLVDATEIKREQWVLTDEGEQYAAQGSPEVQLFNAIPPEGISREELQKKLGSSIFKIGSSSAVKNNWIEMGKSGKPVSRKVQCVDDHVQELLVLIKDGKVVGLEDVNALKKRKLITLRTWSGYSLKKGPNFTLEREKKLTDLTREHLLSGDWKNLEFKKYNFSAKPPPLDGGCLHPLLKVRERFIKIFIEMGFGEMPTNNYVESSFWNFDALFQPQQHPARDSHDTFFLEVPSSTLKLPEDYVERVKQMHQSGGYGSRGYEYDWKREESLKNVLRTHTTAVSARMLYALAQKPFTPRKYFSIDRVFRNEAVDRTHLAEFHQIEGIVIDRGLTLSDLMGTLTNFFSRLGMSNLRFSPTYNPYTEPSMEIYSYHEGLQKWVEIGNSGMFRPEMLRPMGLPEDVTAIAWGLSLERPTMILYEIDNIRDLFGPKVDLSLIKKNPVCRLGID